MQLILSTNFHEPYSYGELKAITDRALSDFDAPLTDEYRNRGWSSILNVVTDPELANVSPMEVMRCVARDDETNGLEFSEWVAICAVALKWVA